jgi:hypothetical protein
MAQTSGTYTYQISVNDIVTEAMQNIGKLGENEGPTAQEFQDCIRKLNMIIKQFQGRADFSKGIKQWTRKQGHLFLSSTTGQYNLGPTSGNWTNDYITTKLLFNAAAGSTSLTLVSTTGVLANSNIGIQLGNGNLFWTTVVGTPIGNTVVIATGLPLLASSTAQVFNYSIRAQQPIVIEWALLRDNTNSDIPITLLNFYDYAQLPSKTDVTNSSDPMQIYVENQIGSSTLYTDVGSASDVTKHIVIGYMEAIQDLSGNPAETIEYPQEYYRAICWLLTREICPMFSADWTQLMNTLCTEALQIATAKDEDTSTLSFQVYE